MGRLPSAVLATAIQRPSGLNLTGSPTAPPSVTSGAAQLPLAKEVSAAGIVEAKVVRLVQDRDEPPVGAGVEGEGQVALDGGGGEELGPLGEGGEQAVVGAGGGVQPYARDREQQRGVDVAGDQRAGAGAPSDGIDLRGRCSGRVVVGPVPLEQGHPTSGACEHQEHDGADQHLAQARDHPCLVPRTLGGAVFLDLGPPAPGLEEVTLDAR